MATSTVAADQTVFVLRTDIVKWGIEQLRERRIHTFFPAYLEIRRATGAKPNVTVRPEWGNVGRYLEVPGGPPKKPYFRPFWNQTRNADQDWLNRNIAGSYSPSSIRETPRRVIEIEGSGYSLKDGHAQLALKHLLYGEPLPLYPLIVFYYRNFGFTSDGSALTPTSLTDIFRTDFHFRDDVDMDEFEVLFTSDAAPDANWFDLWKPARVP